MPGEHLQHLNPNLTTWHITISAYGARLHGGNLPTVSRDQNQPGQPYVPKNEAFEQFEKQRMKSDRVLFTEPQRVHLESVIPDLCERGRWTFRICSAAPPPENDHIHVLLDADPAVHGKRIRHWLKRWLTQSLNEKWQRELPWWVKGGSTKPVKDERYLNNCFRYILKQRTSPFDENKID